MPNFIGDIDFVGDTDPNFAVTMIAGHTYYIDLEGVASPTFPALPTPSSGSTNSSGGRITGDDDGGVGLNSRIVYTATTDGHFSSSRPHSAATSATTSCTSTRTTIAAPSRATAPPARSAPAASAAAR